jgi:AraC-like DNA-binding protein
MQKICPGAAKQFPVGRICGERQRGGELGLAEVALRVGFRDKSKFSFHFERLVGVTPRQFRLSAKNA